MATVTGLTAERMLEIEAASVVDGEVVGDNLILTRQDESTIDAGNVRGPVGALPSGAMMQFAGSAAPTGWLLCDGTAVSRTTYADLFAVVGTTYGVGDGSTTFNVPDTRDRLPMGKSGTKALGSTGGAATKVLTTGNLPAHTHAIDHNHASVSLTVRHAANTETTGTGIRVSDIDGVTGGGGSTGSAVVDLPNFTGSSGNGPGASDPVDILNPYLALNHIIKT